VKLLLALGWLVAVFVPLEWAYPIRSSQSTLRPGLGTDLAFLVGGYLLWNGLALALAKVLAAAVAGCVPAAVQVGVDGLPWWARAGLAVGLADLVVYWGHRAQHAVPLLWRFHAVHHSATELDWVAAHREHPLDTVWTATMLTWPWLALGVPTEVAGTWLAARGIWSIFLHANVDVPVGPFGVLFGSPRLHRLHHAVDGDGNFANLSPLMDVVFGTYRPPREAGRLGLAEPAPSSWAGLLVWPFARASEVTRAAR
jgi:sterol desaturase/sphingolipid hydroxylase (fatty acid hydroxylase superfamily)